MAHSVLGLERQDRAELPTRTVKDKNKVLMLPLHDTWLLTSAIWAGFRCFSVTDWGVVSTSSVNSLCKFSTSDMCDCKEIWHSLLIYYKNTDKKLPISWINGLCILWWSIFVHLKCRRYDHYYSNNFRWNNVWELIIYREQDHFW